MPYLNANVEELGQHDTFRDIGNYINTTNQANLVAAEGSSVADYRHLRTEAATKAPEERQFLSEFARQRRYESQPGTVVHHSTRHSARYVETQQSTVEKSALDRITEPKDSRSPLPLPYSKQPLIMGGGFSGSFGDISYPLPKSSTPIRGVVAQEAATRLTTDHSWQQIVNQQRAKRDERRESQDISAD